MNSFQLLCRGIAAVLFALAALPAAAQSFRVQCPTSTVLHPLANASGQVPTDAGAVGPFNKPNPHIKCQQISGGDGFATMGDGTQTYMFAFGPLSGLSDIVKGLPGTEPAAVFNTPPPDLAVERIGAPDADYQFNGAIGLTGDQAIDVNSVRARAQAFRSTTSPFPIDHINVTVGGNGYLSVPTVTVPNPQGCGPVTGSATCRRATAHAVMSTANPDVVASIVIDNAGAGYRTNSAANLTFNLPQSATNACATASNAPAACIDGHIDARLVMDVGVLNGNIPAPLIAIDEGDELFLTLTNVGQVMRPDLFEQHTVHFHGYPNASAVYDGVPDASIAINIGGSFTYYYLAPEAGTYIWHCHISPPEHLQMGMVGQLYVRPRQFQASGNLGDQLLTANKKSLFGSANTAPDAGKTCADILCAGQTPMPIAPATNAPTGKKYAYNDGDGSTAYDVEYPIQMHGFDPNFHFVGMTFNPESFADNKDKYFLLNGRSYPDTINPNALKTQSTDGVERASQPMRSLITIPAGGRALLRFSDLNVTEYHTLASLGIPMKVIAVNARLLRDLDGNNMYYDTNSITLGGGESIDVILDASNTTKYPSGSVFYLYTPQLDHLSNDAENFGGMMTEVRIN